MSTETKSQFDYAVRFENGLDYESFLDKFGSDVDRKKWKAVFDAASLKPDQQALLESFTREIRVVCMAGAWCGDCVAQCPIFLRFEQASPCIRVRYVDRDADPELAAELQLCGAARVPQVVFLSEDDKPVGRYGDRTLSRYRQLQSELDGAACASGIVNPMDPVFQGVIQDWLNEFERVQLILRTSPSLRRKHGD